MEQKRGSFTNKMGFVLAAAGSAVGLGNIWRFPYLAAKYGGGIFLLVYLILAVTFGFTLMVTEIAIGRKTRLSAIGAFQSLDKRFGFVGYLACAVPFIITPYYCVIGGWVIKYFVTFLTGDGGLASGDEYFAAFTSQTVSPVVWFCIYVLLTAIVVIMGVEKGIEKASRFMMPLLIVMIVGISIYCVTRPGAMEGVKYYFFPDFSKFSATTVLAAMGQLFYSMSLAMGIMITYGSYMKKESSLEASVRQIEVFDTVVAFLAGLMIVPSVFVFSVFNDMALGGVIGAVFFLLVLFAALTSSISLMETAVSILRDKTGWGRKKSTILITIYVLILGTIVSLGFGPLSFIQLLGLGLLDFFDFISNSVLMPIVAILTCICVGHFIGPKVIEDEVELNGPFKIKKFYRIMLKWIAPIFLALILIFAISETMGWIVV